MEQSKLKTIDLPITADPMVSMPLDSVSLQREYIDIMDSLDGDGDSHRRGDEFLLTTNALYHGGPVQWAFIPKVFSRRDAGYLAWIAETMGGIMEKVTAAYPILPELRERFGFDARLDELVSAPVPYRSSIPIARVDVFLNEETGDFQFCELNTDGSSGMLASMEVARANALTDTGARFLERHAASTFDIYTECARIVLDCLRESGNRSERPVIAAVDYVESIAREEIREFTRVFDELGATLRFADIRDLSYSDGSLSDGEGAIDCVWRRVVVSEMLEKPCAGAEALMACARDGSVPIVGGFRTWPCATKTLFAIFSDPIVERILDPDEVAFVRRHVPATYLLDEGSDLSRFSERERWIAKPRDGYNSVGVRAGSDCTDEEWLEVLREMSLTGGTVQAYAPQYLTLNVEGGAAGIGRESVPHANMEGLFLFGNRFAGVFTRCGTAAVIGEFSGRLNMGCLIVED
ncbi:MAG: hypothetical protein SOU51_01320 [Collinsella sp.]|nr:hypothetical protein [Collinsella sp.]